MTKISDLVALTGAGADVAADLVPIVDMSETGAARNKKITLAELKIALGVPAAYTDEQVRDVIAAALVDGTNITITADDGADTITIDAAAGGGLDAEAVMDLVADMLTQGSNVTLTYDDGTDTLTIAAAGGGGGAAALDDLTDVDLTGAATGDVLTKDAGGDWVAAAPSGGGGNYVTASNALGSLATSAHCSRGALIVPVRDLVIDGAWMHIATVSGYTMRAGLYQIDGSNNIAAVMGQTPTKSVTTASAGRIYFDFSTPVTLTAGNRYALLFTRTDTTGNINTYGGTGDSQMPVEALATYLRANTSSPGVATALESGANPYYHGVIFAVG